MKKPKAERAPRTKKARPAAAAILDALVLNKIDGAIRENRIVVEWNELVGDRIAQRTRPLGIHGRTLDVEVASSPWMQELNLMRAQLLASLLERFGEPRLFDDLRFRLAGRARRESLPPRPPARQMPAPPRPPTPATGALREKIVGEVQSVEDPELRELIARVRITHGK